MSDALELSPHLKRVTPAPHDATNESDFPSSLVQINNTKARIAWTDFLSAVINPLYKHVSMV